MKLRIIAVGTRMPHWVTSGFDDYAKRLPKTCALSLIEIPLGSKGATRDPKTATAKEGERMLARIKPGDHVVALDVTGEALSTEALSTRFGGWLQDGRDRVFLIGGPDGLAPECLARADARWSLSALTLPHAIVRVVLAETLYRAWTVLQGHPYHRG